MTDTGLKIGDHVRLRETFGGSRWIGAAQGVKSSSWVKKGVVIEIGTGPKAGRVRVKWSRWIYSDGRPDKIDTKRTWVLARRLGR